MRSDQTVIGCFWKLFVLFCVTHWKTRSSFAFDESKIRSNCYQTFRSFSRKAYGGKGLAEIANRENCYIVMDRRGEGASPLSRCAMFRLPTSPERVVVNQETKTSQQWQESSCPERSCGG
jgi:hypothetical protein